MYAIISCTVEYVWFSFAGMSQLSEFEPALYKYIIIIIIIDEYFGENCHIYTISLFLLTMG